MFPVLVVPPDTNRTVTFEAPPIHLRNLRLRAGSCHETLLTIITSDPGLTDGGKRARAGDCGQWRGSGIGGDIDRGVSGKLATLALLTSKGSAEFANVDITAWDFDGVPRPLEPEATTGSGAFGSLAIGLVGHLAQWRALVEAYHTGRPRPSPAADGLATVRPLSRIS